ncbi:MAG: HNH endonuclease signature motif containing protein [Eubacteriales bacterium]|nr:HNH endonuclease signature motif containing protein [Eubacteriales bacterium]
MKWEKEADPFYYSKPWRKVRKRALERDFGMCVRCMERFRQGGAKPRRADMVHHIIPREERPDLALNLDNLESLCNICHNKEHPEKGMNGSGKREQNPLHRNVRIIKI